MLKHISCTLNKEILSYLEYIEKMQQLHNPTDG